MGVFPQNKRAGINIIKKNNFHNSWLFGIHLFVKFTKAKKANKFCWGKSAPISGTTQDSVSHFFGRSSRN